MKPTSLGFRVVGSPMGERRLIDWLAAFSAYAALDVRAEVEREGFLSAFTFGGDFRTYLERTGTTKGFNGVCGASWLWLDIDRDDVDTATRDARRLAASLVERYCLGGDELLLFFSGRKGYHVGLPLAVVGSPEPSLDFHRVARRFAERLAERAGVAIDPAVYAKVQLFRAPNSRHPKTGLHKRRLTFGELLHLKIEAILRVSAEPAAFDLPELGAVDSQAMDDWREAADETARASTAGRERRAMGTGGRLNRATLGFIRDGAATGERARLSAQELLRLSQKGPEARGSPRPTDANR